MDSCELRLLFDTFYSFSDTSRDAPHSAEPRQHPLGRRCGVQAALVSCSFSSSDSLKITLFRLLSHQRRS